MMGMGIKTPIITVTINTQASTTADCCNIISNIVGTDKTAWIAWADDFDDIVANGSSVCIAVVYSAGNNGSNNEKTVYRSDPLYSHMRKFAYSESTVCSIAVGRKFNVLVIA